MTQLERTPAGRAWLGACKLRVYTRDDYLLRWRRYFADCLGFSYVPGDGDEGEPPPPRQQNNGPAIASAIDLDLWKGRAGLTDRQLAEMLEVSQSYVSRVRSGRVPWSKKFAAKVAAKIGATIPTEAEGCREAG